MSEFGTAIPALEGQVGAITTVSELLHFSPTLHGKIEYTSHSAELTLTFVKLTKLTLTFVLTFIFHAYSRLLRDYFSMPKMSLKLSNIYVGNVRSLIISHLKAFKKCTMKLKTYPCGLHFFKTL